MIDGAMTFVAGDERFLCETGASGSSREGLSTRSEWKAEPCGWSLFCTSRHGTVLPNAGLPAAAPTLPPADAPTRPLEEIEKAMLNHGHDLRPANGPGRVTTVWP